MAIRAVFFDFGGTLARGELLVNEPWRAWVRAADTVGLRLEEREIRRLNAEADARFDGLIYAYHGRTAEFWKMRDGWVIERLGITERADEYFDALQAIFNDYSLIHPYPEALDALRTTKARGLYVGVISNFNDALLPVLKYHGLDQFVDDVTYSEAVGVEKPDPRIFEHALRKAGCAPVRALHVGDSWEADYLGARGAGMEAVWLNRPGRSAPAPCREIRDLTALLPMI